MVFLGRCDIMSIFNRGKELAYMFYHRSLVSDAILCAEELIMRTGIDETEIGITDKAIGLDEEFVDKVYELGYVDNKSNAIHSHDIIMDVQYGLSTIINDMYESKDFEIDVWIDSDSLIGSSYSIGLLVSKSESVSEKVSDLIWELENTRWFIGEVMEHVDVYGVKSVDMSLYVLRDDSNQHVFGLLDGTQGQEEFNQIGAALEDKIEEEYGDNYDYRIMVSSKWDNGFSLRVWVERLITTDFRQVL